MKKHMIMVANTSIEHRMMLLSHLKSLGEVVGIYAKRLLKGNLHDFYVLFYSSQDGCWVLSSMQIPFKTSIPIDDFIKKFPIKPTLDLHNIYSIDASEKL